MKREAREKVMTSGDAASLMEQAARARREGRPSDAHRNHGDALAVCRASGARADLVQALKGLGQIERDLGHGDAARSLYEEAVAVYREEGDALALAHTVRHLGDIHQDAGRVELAEPCYLEALAIYRRHESTSTLDLANAVRPLAMLKDHAGDVDDARRLWREARELYQAVDVPEGVAECSARLARLDREAS